VGHLDAFVARAAAAGSRDLAIFQRRRAELLAHYNAGVSPLREFVTVAGIPLTSTQDGRVVAVFPFDLVAWTDINGGLVDAMTSELEGGSGVELVITGQATPLARSRLNEIGWTLTEDLQH
jgi:hypothetical protein